MARQRTCRSCGIPAPAGLCGECSEIRKTSKRIRRFERAARRQRVKQGVPVGPVLSDDEVFSLATCDTDPESQRIVNTIIRRESAVIRSTWSKADYYRRAGVLVRRWTAPVMRCDDIPEQGEDDG